ncbi:MAG: DUF2971 domain-containing protein [Candidatus Atribacteria bacterium]|nr:DUF2971 domain-containing protein [Candidatus Atribacteria bacterium]MBN2747647.1 DUF2971 domain-containing protein [Bacteroidales bacterium]
MREYELYLPSISQLNDPFEGAIPFVYDQAELTPENIFLKLYSMSKKEHPDWDDSKIHEHVFNEYKRGTLFDDKHLENNIKNTRDDIERNFGVLSLTTQKNNFLMWSHYAESHKGICIGFDTEILSNTIGGVLGAAIYQRELPKFSMIQETMEFMAKLLFTKSDVWIYEDEYRITKFNAARKTYKLPKNAIKEVILGMSMPHTLKNELISIITEKLPDISVFDTSLNKSTFDIDLLQIR